MEDIYINFHQKDGLGVKIDCRGELVQEGGADIILSSYMDHIVASRSPITIDVTNKVTRRIFNIK